jgi:hypothetical protein
MHALLLILAEVAGWAFIIAGLALAVSTLAANNGPVLAGRPLKGVAVLAPSETSSMRKMHPASEWQRLEDIAERGFSSIARLAELHARAVEAVAAAEIEANALLAEWSSAYGAALDPPPAADIPPTADPEAPATAEQPLAA